MSANLVDLRTQEFSSRVELLLQQEGSLLEQTCMSGTHVGKQASPVNQIGAITALKVTSRFGTMPRIDAPTDRRWVFPVDYHAPQLVDTLDELKMALDVKSSYATNGAFALGRAKDVEIAAGYFGTSKTGETGATSTTFPAGQKVSISFGASGSVGLTVKKLKEARRLLLKAKVNLKREKLWCIVTALQHDQLLDEIQVTSKDYNPGIDGMPVLVEGMVQRFLGMTFILYEDLPVDSSSDRQVPVYVSSAMYLGSWQEVTTTISQRNDLESEPWQINPKMSLGATRLEEKRIVQITCDE